MVRAGPRSFVVLRHANHVKVVLQTCKTSNSMSSHEEMGKIVFGTRYAGDAGAEKWKEAMNHAHSILPQKHLSAAPLTSITNIYVSILSSNLNNKMFQVGTWTLIEDFLSFFQQVVTRCVLETLLGSAIFKRYSNLVKDYQKLADSVDDFMPGMPAYIMSAASKELRDRLLDGMERWLKANHSGLEFAKISDEDAVWDEDKGSKFIQESDSVFTKVDNANLKARAAEILCVVLGCV